MGIFPRALIFWMICWMCIHVISGCPLPLTSLSSFLLRLPLSLSFCSCHAGCLTFLGRPPPPPPRTPLPRKASSCVSPSSLDTPPRPHQVFESLLWHYHPPPLLSFAYLKSKGHPPTWSPLDPAHPSLSPLSSLDVPFSPSNGQYIPCVYFLKIIVCFLPTIII